MYVNNIHLHVMCFVQRDYCPLLFSTLEPGPLIGLEKIVVYNFPDKYFHYVKYMCNI